MTRKPLTSEISRESAAVYWEEMILSGHIIDSLLLPKVMDLILKMRGTFELEEVKIGTRVHEESRVLIRVGAPSEVLLQNIVQAVSKHGVQLVNQDDCLIRPADMEGAFPESFYATTNLQTEVRIDGKWIPVAKQEMDCGIRVDLKNGEAECVPMSDVLKDDLIVVGHRGVRIEPQLRRDSDLHDEFRFMDSNVSSEKPKHITVTEIANSMKKARTGEGKILVVGGPAIVHTGSREHLSWMIREGFIDLLFAGNALATHDIEQSFYNTSLGVSMKHGGGTSSGHEHHLRSINRIRREGSLEAAVRNGVLKNGIMYECVMKPIPYLLAGSIRDDGPLPDVITDVVQAQREMRELCRGVSFALMIATTLHSIAVGNLLPADVKVVCVDINPATVTKLSDRGTFQTVGLVTDVEPFLRVLAQELGRESVPDRH